MKVVIKKEAKTIMSNPDSKHNYFGWPSVAKLQNGNIAVTASGFRLGHICPFGKCVMSLSSDNGESYVGPMPIIDTPLDDRDSGVVPFGESGVIVTSFNNTRKMQRVWNPVSSDIQGDYLLRNKYCHAYLDTVKDEEEQKYCGATYRISLDCGKSFGELHISSITSPHGPTELHDGTLLWVGRVFCEGSFDESSDRVYAYSMGLDGSMEKVGMIPPIYEDGNFIVSCEPHAIELPNGKIICHIRAERHGYFTTYQSESLDGGKTWSQPRQLLAQRGGAPAHLLLHSSGTLISTYGFRIEPYGVRAMFSKDGGETWDIDHWVYDNGGVSGDLGYPCSTELDNGDILTVFYAKDSESEPAVIKQVIWNFEE